MVTPKLLVCPADTRLPAASFATLSNANLSYFIGLNAEFARPTSILAGDRNLTNDYATPGTVVRLGQSYALRWTDEMHRFKGNLLFSDGHVEQKNNPALVFKSGQIPAVANLALPSVRQPGFPAPSSGGESSAWTPALATAPSAPVIGTFKPETNAKTFTAAIPVSRAGRSRTPEWMPVAPAGGPPTEKPSAPKVEKQSTNAVTESTPAKAESESAILSQFGQWVTAATGGLVEKGMWWFYTILLLLAIATVVLVESVRGRKGRATEPPMRFP